MTYLRFDASALPNQVGIDGPGGSRLSDGRSGFITYGPYFEAESGTYIAGFYVRRTGKAADQALQIDVLAGGNRTLARIDIPHAELFEDIPRLAYLTFELCEPTSGIEVRMHIEASISIELQSLVIFRTQLRNWGGL